MYPDYIFFNFMKLNWFQKQLFGTQSKINFRTLGC